jgi:O-antigen/teichoic acid export membrane protein
MRSSRESEFRRLASRGATFLKGVGVFSAVQAATQVLAMLAGLLWVRVLSREEFALYALCGSAIALSAVLSDLGAGSSLQYFFRRGKGETAVVTPYVDAIRRLRALLAAGVAPVTAAVLLTGAETGRSLTLVLVLAVVLVPATVVAQHENSVRWTVLRLSGRWSPVYRAELTQAALRLVGVGVVVATRTTSALAAVIANLVATIGVLPLVAGAVPPGVGSAASHRAEVRAYLKPLIPDTAYFALQGQLVLWIAAFFGSVQQVADVGALARLGLLLSVPQSLAVSYFVPKLAGIHDERRFLHGTVRYGGFLLLIALALIGLVAWRPAAVLSILGASYLALDREVLAILLTGILSLLGAYVAQVNRSRAWTAGLWRVILAAVSAQLVYAAAIPLESTLAMLGLGLTAAAVLLTGHLSMAITGFLRTLRADRRQEPA